MGRRGVGSNQFQMGITPPRITTTKHSLKTTLLLMYRVPGIDVNDIPLQQCLQSGEVTFFSPEEQGRLDLWSRLGGICAGLLVRLRKGRLMWY